MAKGKVIVTGANGQLGVDLVKTLKGLGYEVYGMGREELDFSYAEQVDWAFRRIRPDVVIHAGAYTKVDQAEKEPAEAFRVNGFGTRHVASAAEEVGAKLVYVSTDYVFDGESGEPYGEEALTNPLNVYGQTKLAGEKFVRAVHSRSFIVRTSWVFGAHGPNFVKTMLRLGAERDTVSVVGDQIGCPTYTVDLANCIARLIETESYGTYHVSNTDSCSWYEFAQRIFDKAGTPVRVEPITTAEFPRPAKRPAHSVLEHGMLRKNGFPDLRSWREALDAFFEELLAEAEQAPVTRSS
ncbi:dTDP-4-dehydrorhamnose reductase [Paenibacillus aurantius]|uniref:dTDP-4-dehydrorhamnose reductase n=1 Tax=Paenibacillus aurantius TaxID=2918900 RepID=A0AA96LCT3_9BACL|nr:dTDP-4-dehydrorhamnose reductase [Paenibacillus aurantius]WNQ10823.1 dTDP-4-dehydrorhamnose reductase [Paenibacillus aurantius]